MKQLKRERYRNMVKRINNLPNDKQMFVIGVINGMLISEETKNGAEVIEKTGQEVDIHMKKENNPKEQTTVRLPLELKERIQREANRKGMSFNELVLIILYMM